MEDLLLTILGGIADFLLDLLLQLFFELFADLLARVLKEPLRRPEPLSPDLALLGCALYGAVAGGISLLLVPRHLAHSALMRQCNFFLVPLAAALAMGGLGAWRHRQEKEVIRLETFFCAYAFAFAMALVRLIFAH